MTISNSATGRIADEIIKTLHPTSATLTLGTLTLTYPILIRLMATNGSATTDGTAITDGGSYVNASGISIGANWAAVSSGTGSQATNAAVSQTNMPAATTVGIELWDSTATKKRMELGTITSKTTVLGDTLTFSSGAITSALT